MNKDATFWAIVQALEDYFQKTNGGVSSWGAITGTLSSQTDLQSALDGKSVTSHNHDASYSPVGHNHSGVYEPANANIQSHVVSAHAPSNAQANADITKAEIEVKLTGVISSHSHSGGGVAWGGITGTLSAQTDLQGELDGKSGTGHNHDATYQALGGKNAANGYAGLDASSKLAGT